MTSPTDEVLALTHELFHRQREIKKIERQVLAQRGRAVPGAPYCSFCGWAKEEVSFVIHGEAGAYICSNCAVIVGTFVKDKDVPPK